MKDRTAEYARNRAKRAVARSIAPSCVVEVVRVVYHFTPLLDAFGMPSATLQASSVGRRYRDGRVRS